MRHLYQIWIDLSIRFKTSFLMTVVCLIVLIITIIGSIQMDTFTEQSKEIMNEYQKITTFIEAFSTENVALEEYMRPINSASSSQVYHASIEKTDNTLKKLELDALQTQLDRRALKRAIQNAMEHYRESQTYLWTIEDPEELIDHYLLLKKQAAYIDGYARRLLDVSMDYGSQKWDQIERNNQRATVQFTALMMLTVVLLLMIAFIFNHHVMRPIQKLSRAAATISAGCYDAPPVIVPGQNELGQTARSFNLMQTRIRQTIRALERQSEIEKQLLEKEVEGEQMRRKLQEGRFAQLQSQINPHFLFNTLNTIAAMAHEEEAPLSEDLILRLSNFFRYSLGSDEKLVPLGREIMLLRDYMELQETRYGDRIAMEVLSDPSLESVLVPKFILQPLVENSIIHGLSGQPLGGLIRVRSYRGKRGITITITDNGCGFDLNQHENIGRDHHGVGLDNITERVELIHGEVKIFSRPGLGTCVRIVLKEETGA